MIDYTLPLDELPDPLPIVPLAKPFDVIITPPGSKSITNRAYVLAALAQGESRIIRPLRAEDTDLLLEALCTLGAEARWEGEDVFIKGVGGRFPRGGSVCLGDGGTPTRFMIAAACLAAEPVIVDGSPRMRERPIAEGVEMLRQLGAKIEYVEEEGRLPVRVVPSDSFKGGELHVGKTASSQFISAVMLIAPWLENGVAITFAERVTSAAYIWLTFKVMDEWHIHSECSLNASMEARSHDGVRHQQAEQGEDGVGWVRTYSGTVPTRSGKIEGQTFTVSPDASGAAYWVVATSLVSSSQAIIPGFQWDDGQADVAIAHLFRDSNLSTKSTRRKVWETLFANEGRAVVGRYDASNAPDGAMAIAAMSACIETPTTITGLHTLRVKETDRLAALANELRKIGCTVETTQDSIMITPPREPLNAAESARAEPGPNRVVIETYNDHRMAMSFAVLGLVRPGISIRNPKCVAKSYPTFWKDFAKLYR